MAAAALVEAQMKATHKKPTLYLSFEEKIIPTISTKQTIWDIYLFAKTH